MSMALGALPLVQLLQSACKFMCRHKFNWNIVACDVKVIPGLYIQKALYDLSYLGSKRRMVMLDFICSGSAEALSDIQFKYTCNHYQFNTCCHLKLDLCDKNNLQINKDKNLMADDGGHGVRSML